MSGLLVTSIGIIVPATKKPLQDILIHELADNFGDDIEGKEAPSDPCKNPQLEQTPKTLKGEPDAIGARSGRVEGVLVREDNVDIVLALDKEVLVLKSEICRVLSGPILGWNMGPEKDFVGGKVWALGEEGLIGRICEKIN